MFISGQSLSVVIPTYNADQTIAPLLESVLGQQIKPREILVVDDCSTDETVRIVKRYPVRVIQQTKNGGAACARNRGIQEAQGDIIMFLDSDTYLMPGSIEAVIDGFNTRENVHAQNGICHPIPLNRGWSVLYKALIESSWADDLEDWNDLAKCINARVGAFTKASLIEFGGFDERYLGASVEDHEFGIRYARKYKIYTNKRFIVRHHFSNFLETINNYWQRTCGMMELLHEQKNVMKTGGVLGALDKPAIQCGIGFLLFWLFFLTMLFSEVWYIWIVLFFIYVCVSLTAFKRLFSQGPLFGLYGVILHIIYGVVVCSAALTYELHVWFAGKK